MNGLDFDWGATFNRALARGEDHGAAAMIADDAEAAARRKSKRSTMPTEHILQFFAYEHLPPHLKLVSADFATLADRIVATLPRNPERTVALRKLLEAKDAAVRARLAVEPD